MSGKMFVGGGGAVVGGASGTSATAALLQIRARSARLDSLTGWPGLVVRAAAELPSRGEWVTAGVMVRAPHELKLAVLPHIAIVDDIKLQ